MRKRFNNPLVFLYQLLILYNYLEQDVQLAVTHETVDVEVNTPQEDSEDQHLRHICVGCECLIENEPTSKIECKSIQLPVRGHYNHLQTYETDVGY